MAWGKVEEWKRRSDKRWTGIDRQWRGMTFMIRLFWGRSRSATAIAIFGRWSGAVCSQHPLVPLIFWLHSDIGTSPSAWVVLVSLDLHRLVAAGRIVVFAVQQAATATQFCNCPLVDVVGGGVFSWLVLLLRLLLSLSRPAPLADA